MTVPRSKRPGRGASVDDVLKRFDDACIRELAKIAGFPADTDLGPFANRIRDAVRIYLRDAATPTHNEINAAITKLYRAADREEYGRVATLLEELAPAARNFLQLRGELPHPSELLDADRRVEASATVATICRIGGKWVQGRKRPTGKRSVSWQPELFAPNPSPNFAKRNAELNFVMWFRVAWVEATGTQPTRTAGHEKPGPFVRFIKQCLKLVGAHGVDAVNLINTLDERRRFMEKRESKADRTSEHELSGIKWGTTGGCLCEY